MPMLPNESRFKLKLKLEDSSPSHGSSFFSPLAHNAPGSSRRLFSHTSATLSRVAVMNYPTILPLQVDTQRDAVSGGWGWRSRMDDGLTPHNLHTDTHTLSRITRNAQVLLLLPPRLPRCLDDANACEPRKELRMRTVCHACHECALSPTSRIRDCCRDWLAHGLALHPKAAKCWFVAG
jgi:hypothetical protein